jgi:chromosome segregation ATPase
MKQFLLEGEVDTRDTEIERLRGQIEDLSNELEVARAEAKRATQQAARAVAKLRQTLGPLYNSLQMLFGEIDATGLAEDAPAGSVGTQAANPKWDTIKARLAPRMREAIDILLIQKTMKRTQLAAALRMDYSNCNKNVIGLLLRQGLLIDNGQGLSLKEL